MNPPTDTRTFREKLRETHAHVMNMGPTGPVVALCVFVSSLGMNLYMGIRSITARCEHWIRNRQ